MMTVEPQGLVCPCNTPWSGSSLTSPPACGHHGHGGSLWPSTNVLIVTINLTPTKTEPEDAA